MENNYRADEFVGAGDMYVDPKFTQRGLRNNNPGNIEDGIKWKGLAAFDDDSRFCVFKFPEFGIRAIVKILYTYQRKHNLKTIFKMISRWAPPNENDTEAYAKFVALAAGVGMHTEIDLITHPKITIKVVAAIIEMENGLQPYSQIQLEKAVEMAAM